MIKIKALNPIVSMSLLFESDGNNYRIPIKLDSANRKVYFDFQDGEKYDGVDFSLLETEVLDYINPNLDSPPKIPEEVLRMMQSAKTGNYKDII